MTATYRLCSVGNERNEEMENCKNKTAAVLEWVKINPMKCVTLNFHIHTFSHLGDYCDDEGKLESENYSSTDETLCTIRTTEILSFSR